MPHGVVGSYSPKPATKSPSEYETSKTQVVATGSKEPRNDTNVEAEAAATGAGKRVGGHGQGGAGH